MVVNAISVYSQYSEHYSCEDIIICFCSYVTPMLVISIHASYRCQSSVKGYTRKNVQLHFHDNQKKCTSPFSCKSKVYKSIFTSIKNVYTILYYKICTITSPFSRSHKILTEIYSPQKLSTPGKNSLRVVSTRKKENNYPRKDSAVALHMYYGLDIIWRLSLISFGALAT